MFLSELDIQNLTGYKACKSQMQWLSQNGIKFLIGQDGKPRVLTKVVEAAMGFSPVPQKKVAQPNVVALKRHLGIV